MFINLGVFITLARGTLGSNRFQVSAYFAFSCFRSEFDKLYYESNQLSIFLAIAVVMAVIGVK